MRGSILLLLVFSSFQLLCVKMYKYFAAFDQLPLTHLKFTNFTCLFVCLVSHPLMKSNAVTNFSKKCRVIFVN